MSEKTKIWANVTATIRCEVNERLRAGMLSAVDQAERFRNPDSNHANEAVAATWDTIAEDYRVALNVLVAAAKKVTRK